MRLSNPKLTAGSVPVTLRHIDLEIPHGQHHGDTLTRDEADVGCVTSQGGVSVLYLHLDHWLVLVHPVIKMLDTINLLGK